MRRLMIIETGVAAGEIAATFGRYGDMMVRMFEEAGVSPGQVDISPIFETNVVPDFGAGDSILITGSPAGVYEDHPWIPPLEEMVRGAISAEIPIAGICFGHQLMAQAMGGQVEKSEKGWGVGIHTYERMPDADRWLPPGPQQFRCAVSHQDQVTRLPPNATWLAGSAFCPYGAIAYRESALSIQMHPEFAQDFASALLASRASVIPAPVAELAAKTLEEGASDRQWLTHAIARTLQIA